MSLSTDLAGARASARSALRGATPKLEALLGTVISRQEEVTDYYSWSPPRYQKPRRHTDLYLQNGMVDSTADFAVYGVRGSGFVQKNAAHLVSTERYRVDHTRGIVRLLYEPAISSESVAIEYSSGLSSRADDTDDTIIYFNDVPEWLKEAAIVMAIKILHEQTTTYNKSSFKIRSKELTEDLSIHLNNKSRPKMNGIFPAIHEP